MADGVPRQRIARLNSDGTLDPVSRCPRPPTGPAAPSGRLPSSRMGGYWSAAFSPTSTAWCMNYIARLNPDGSLDSLFNPGSGADNRFMPSPRPNDSARRARFISAAALRRLAERPSTASPGSTPTARWTAPSIRALGANATVYALAVQPDGRVVIGGDFTAVNGNTNFNHIARLNTDGSVDTNFNERHRRERLGPRHRHPVGRQDSHRRPVHQCQRRRLELHRPPEHERLGGRLLPARARARTIGVQHRIADRHPDCAGRRIHHLQRRQPQPHHAAESRRHGGSDHQFRHGRQQLCGRSRVQEDTIFGYPTNVPDEKIIIGGGFTQYNGQPHAYLARIYGGSIERCGRF
jgi:uncharacterized delta-60 repeat protein